MSEARPDGQDLLRERGLVLRGALLLARLVLYALAIFLVVGGGYLLTFVAMKPDDWKPDELATHASFHVVVKLLTVSVAGGGMGAFAADRRRRS